jgi:hypothetical protein
MCYIYITYVLLMDYLYITYVLRIHYVYIISVILKIDISFLHSINGFVFAMDVTFLLGKNQWH